MLTVDLGCRRAGALEPTRLNRPPPIGRSQSATDLLSNVDEEDAAKDQGQGHMTRNSDSNMVGAERDNLGFVRGDNLNTSEVQLVVESFDKDRRTMNNSELDARKNEVQVLSDTIVLRGGDSVERDENHNWRHSEHENLASNSFLAARTSGSEVSLSFPEVLSNISNSCNSSDDVTEANDEDDVSAVSTVIHGQEDCSPGKRRNRKKTEKKKNEKIEKTYFV